MTRLDLGIFNIITPRRGLSAVHLVHTDYRRMVSLHSLVILVFWPRDTRTGLGLGRVWHGVQCRNGWSIGPAKITDVVLPAPGSPAQLISLSVDKVSQPWSGDSPQLNTRAQWRVSHSRTKDCKLGRWWMLPVGHTAGAQVPRSNRNYPIQGTLFALSFFQYCWSESDNSKLVLLVSCLTPDVY